MTPSASRQRSEAKEEAVSETRVAAVKEYICPRGHRSTSTVRGVCWNCYPGGRGPAEQEERTFYPEAVFAALKAERDRLYAENVDLRARIAAARARLPEGGRAQAILDVDVPDA
jgi:hypothetical protein